MLSGSFLDGSYLGGSEVLTNLPTQAPAEMLPSPDLIQLPGGIVMTRRNFWILVAAIVAAGLLWLRSRDRE